MDMNVIVLPDQRGTSLTAAGRSGDIWIADGGFNTIEIKRRIRVPLSKYDAMVAWLNQSGMLEFSFMPGYAYDTRFNKNGSGRSARTINFTQVTLDADPLFEGTLVFVCQPYRYITPAANDVTISSSGGTIRNVGTAPSQPKVVINGSGSFRVTIGTGSSAITMAFKDVTGGGIVVDSMLGDVFSYDEALLANDKAEGPLFEIQPGQQVVQWVEGDTDDSGNVVQGSVTSVVITPRWRCY